MHISRYFTWAALDDSSLSPARRALRLALRALGAAASPQYRFHSEALYRDSKAILEGVEFKKDVLEQIQAWLLILQFECLRVCPGTAMITAGRPLRLIQISRLWNMDRHKAHTEKPLGTLNPGEAPTLATAEGEVFALTEEKRRAFWLAYCWERFFCVQNDWPLTLQEDTVRGPNTVFFAGRD